VMVLGLVQFMVVDNWIVLSYIICATNGLLFCNLLFPCAHHIFMTYQSKQSVVLIIFFLLKI
jgi:hypothetical protein